MTNEQLKLIDKRENLTETEAWDRFILTKQMIGVSDRTVSHYYDIKHVIHRDLQILKISKSLHELNTKDIECLIMYWKKQVKVPTINSRIKVLKTFYRVLANRKMIKSDPMKELHQLKEKEIIKHTLSEGEISKLINNFRKGNTFVNYRNLVMLELLIDTGLRLSEILSLKVFNISETALIVNETKSKRQRVVYPSKHCLNSLKTYIKIRGIMETDYLFVSVHSEGKLSKRHFQDILSTAGKKCGIKKTVSPQVLRRTYAKYAVMKGIDPFSLARLLGHEDIQTTKRYVQIYGQDLYEQSKKRGDFSKLFENSQDKNTYI